MKTTQMNKAWRKKSMSYKVIEIIIFWGSATRIQKHWLMNGSPGGVRHITHSMLITYGIVFGRSGYR
jgi:hypothetical protein